MTNERISTLSALLDNKMDVIIEDLFEETTGEAPRPAGTRVIVTIPVKDES